MRVYVFPAHVFGAICIFLTDPVGNGTTKDRRLDPTPVDQLLAVSCSVFFPTDQSASPKIKVFTIIMLLKPW